MNTYHPSAACQKKLEHSYVVSSGSSNIPEEDYDDRYQYVV
jgi:hypothetical protein